MEVLGIDIGGSGIKGAPVDVATGDLTDDRFKVKTPDPSTPALVAEAVKEVAAHFGWTGPMGVTFPGLVINGLIRTAPNLDRLWPGEDSQSLFSEATGLEVTVLNDADAAGVAEMTFGAGKDHAGTVLMLTFGTGIGSALFRGGVLVPNTEFGHLEIRGREAESRASAAVKEKNHLSWKKWSARVNEYLAHLEALMSPDLFIVGGGISRESNRFLHLLSTLGTVVPAKLQNEAGIVGAAMAASG